MISKSKAQPKFRYPYKSSIPFTDKNKRKTYPLIHLSKTGFEYIIKGKKKRFLKNNWRKLKYTIFNYYV